MKRKYTLIDHCNNNGEPMEITYDHPIPFCEKLNESLKTIYGSSFIKRIDHVKKEVEIYNRYDSGKGMIIIPPNETKPITVNNLLKDFVDSDNTVMIIKNNARTEYMIQKTNFGAVVWKDASYKEGRISGIKYTHGTIEHIKKVIGNIANVYSYYPTGNEHLELNKQTQKDAEWAIRRETLDYDRDFINLCKAGDKHACVWLYIKHKRSLDPDVSFPTCINECNEIYYQYNPFPK